MVTVDHLTASGRERPSLAGILATQRAAFATDGPASAATRVDRIDRVIRAVTARADDLLDALQLDYGHRSRTQSVAADLLASVSALKHSRRHVRRWMSSDRRRAAGLGVVGGRARIEWQALGVVGIISPWNFPVTLSLHPLGQAFAAGNRAMVKVSEITAATGEVLADAIGQHLDPTEVAVVTGGPEVASEFAGLAFDHLFFTGSTEHGRQVLRAAADNLVPVTLELGGKCPAVIAPGADLDRAARSIMFGKTFNAGQFCVAPDYAFVPTGLEEEFTVAARRAVAKMYPSGIGDDDYTAVVNAHHFDRLLGYLDDARARGATVTPLTDDPPPTRTDRPCKLAPMLLRHTDDTMRITREEVFGPLLPVLAYGAVDEVIEYVNARPAPLASYYFGPSDRRRKAFLVGTVSGGVTTNDIMLHVGLEGLPFGGVGASGMGQYHGRAGFETFSHGKPVVQAPRVLLTRFANPPYSHRASRIIRAVIDRAGRAAARRDARSSATSLDQRSANRG